MKTTRNRWDSTQNISYMTISCGKR